MLIRASASPRRRELLHLVTDRFEVVTSEVDERALTAPTPALLVPSLDWLFLYYMPGYAGAALRYIAFVLPSAVLTLPAALLAFWLVQRIHDGFRIDNGVV